MFQRDTDKEWEQFGEQDPYFGVLTDERYRVGNLTESDKERFFQSGFGHIEHALEKVRTHLDPDYRIKRAVDFGCGVGRLVVPLAEAAEYVVGVDVSDSMLEEAKKNCEARSISNVGFIKSDDELSLLKGQFDFIHSHIVFQHIPSKRGERIFEQLLTHLEDGGVGVTQFIYAADSIRSRLAPWIKRNIPLSKYLINLINGKSLTAPQMQMNVYNLNRLFLIMQRSNISRCYTEYSDHGKELGIVLYFKKGVSR